MNGQKADCRPDYPMAGPPGTQGAPAAVASIDSFSMPRSSWLYLDAGANPISLKDKHVVVTGGSRGLGLGLVEALVAHGARVTVVARDAEALASVRTRLGVATLSADVTDETSAHRIVAEARPDILALNAGTPPRMARFDQTSWADFTAPWDTDVKAGLYWMQAALKTPLKPGSRVLVGSSGAAVNGSQMSGGYGGTKRMLWFMAKYANGIAAQKDLGIRFQAIVSLSSSRDTRDDDDASVRRCPA